MGEIFTSAISASIAPTEIDNVSAEEIVESVDILDESPETISIEDSVICLDEDDEYSLPNLPSALEDVGGRSETVSDIDDDFCIVYEKVVPPSDIQYVIYDSSENGTLSNESNQIQKQPLHSDYIRHEDRKNTDSPDDSVHFVGEYSPPTFPSDHATPNPTKTKNTEHNEDNKAPLDSVERKKRKIECTVCFDGPDEITLKGCTLVSTVCGHIFCSACIKEVIKISKLCPQCRTKLTAKKYHPLFI